MQQVSNQVASWLGVARVVVTYWTQQQPVEGSQIISIAAKPVALRRWPCVPPYHLTQSLPHAAGGPCVEQLRLMRRIGSPCQQGVALGPSGAGVTRTYLRGTRPGDLRTKSTSRLCSSMEYLPRSLSNSLGEYLHRGKHLVTLSVQNPLAPLACLASFYNLAAVCLIR